MPRKRIRITSIRKNPPDTRLIAKALIELVLEQQEQEELRHQTREPAPTRKRDG